MTQSSDQSSGPLASISVAGNLHRLRIHPGGQTGSWKIQVDSVKSYSVKVTGQWQHASGALFSSSSAHVQMKALSFECLLQESLLYFCQVSAIFVVYGPDWLDQCNHCCCFLSGTKKKMK